MPAVCVCLKSSARSLGRSYCAAKCESANDSSCEVCEPGKMRLCSCSPKRDKKTPPATKPPRKYNAGPFILFPFFCIPSFINYITFSLSWCKCHGHQVERATPTSTVRWFRTSGVSAGVVLFVIYVFGLFLNNLSLSDFPEVSS